MKNIQKHLLLALTLMIVLLLNWAASIQAEEPLTADQAQTLQSLRKIDPFPLYEMQYVGDYGLGAFLKEGQPRQSGRLPVPAEHTQDWACTVFAALAPDSAKILGRNFDWYTHPALLLFTAPPDGYASVSMVDVSYLGLTQDDASWTENSRALLQSPYLPFDGMNTQGLAVGMMAVSQADGGSDPQKMTLNSLLIIRVLLDYAKDVEEALVLLSKYNIDFQGGPPLHYLIADASGKSVIVEFLAGERDLPQSRSLAGVHEFIIAPIPPENRPAQCWRYAKASARLTEAGGKLGQAEAMPLLQSVSSDNTIWSTVYNLTTRDMQVVMGRTYQNIHQFRLKK